MKKKEISRLLQRYLACQREGRDAYFDADEVDELLDSFEESDDFTYYDEVLALGLRLHPGNPDLQIRQCKSYVYNEDYDSALVLIDSLGERDNEELDMLRLECYVMQDSYDKVLRYIEKLTSVNCDYLEAVFEYIAPLLGDMEMTKEARDFVDRGLRLFPDNLILKDELCYSLEEEGKIDQAIQVCDELIDANPYSNDYWFNLGRLHSINGDFEKAIEAFDFALACDDSDDELKILKAYCLYMNENYEKAIEVYNEVATTEGLRLRVLPRLAECHIKMGDYETAYTMLKELLKQEPRPEEASSYFSLMRCCIETGREQEACDTLMSAAKLFPNNIRLLSLVALTYQDRGEEHKAKEVTRRLFDVLDQEEEIQPEDVESLFCAGQCLFMKGEIDQALRYYKRVLEADPKRPNLHLHIAMAYLAKGDLEHFGEHYKQISSEEVLDYLNNSGAVPEEKRERPESKPVTPEELVREFLNNKDNKN